ncbi:MAG: uracil-DNA glycosylase family protein [Daejeonella sp.]
MMIDQTLAEKLAAFDKEIFAGIDRDRDQVEPILDGIIDLNKYRSAKYKILWILKEAYDDFDKNGNPKGGNWDLRDMLRKRNSARDFAGGGRRTFMRMLYASCGILNDFTEYDNITDLDKDPSVLNALKSIAYINVKKLPGRKLSNDSIIADAYKSCKDLLLKQIKLIDPHIIIGGATLHHFIHDLQLSEIEKHRQGSANYFVKGDKIYIQAYHPGYWGISEELYCNDIILAAKQGVIIKSIK